MCCPSLLLCCRCCHAAAAFCRRNEVGFCIHSLFPRGHSQKIPPERQSAFEHDESVGPVVFTYVGAAGSGSGRRVAYQQVGGGSKLHYSCGPVVRDVYGTGSRSGEADPGTWRLNWHVYTVASTAPRPPATGWACGASSHTAVPGKLPAPTIKWL